MIGHHEVDRIRLMMRSMVVVQVSHGICQPRRSYPF